jgi:hypothetical protein
MDRVDAQRLWPQLRLLLRAPAPPDDPELRRAARLLVASRGDAVELLLARWLADTAAAAGRPHAGEGAAADAGRGATAGPAEGASEGGAEDAARPAAARRAPVRRDATLVASGLVAGVVGTALLGGLLDDELSDGA